MHADGVPGSNIHVYLDGFIRVDMVGTHKPPWFVCADRQQCEIEVPLLVADILEVICIAGVACKE